MKTHVLGLMLVLLSLAGCGERHPRHPSSTPRAAGTLGATPASVFDAMRAEYIARDFAALYELNAPSERAAVEAKWQAALKSDDSLQIRTNFAVETGIHPDKMMGMTFRQVVMARDAAKAKSAPGRERIGHIRNAQLIKVGEEKDGLCMVRFRYRDGEQQLPMKKEAGRWYLYRRLTALSDFGS